MRYFSLILMHLIGGLLTCVHTQVPDEAILKENLFENYFPDLLPSREIPNTVAMRMTLNKIRALDLYEGTIQMNVWMHYTWNDPRLTWDPNSFGNITTFLTLASDVWRPDITLYNSNSAPEMLADDVHVSVVYDGRVEYFPPMRLHASCTQDLRDYPYDSHNCSLKFGSWSYDSSKISLELISGIDLSGLDTHPIWDIVYAMANKNTHIYPCCVESYEDITFSVVVRRQETHGRIASSVITTWLILIVFLIAPSSAGQRIFFAGFIFVALVVLSAALSAEIPAYSETRLGRFLISGMLITVIVSVVNGFIYRFYPKEKPGQLQEGDGVPSRIFLVIDIGAFLITAIILGISTGALFV